MKKNIIRYGAQKVVNGDVNDFLRWIIEQSDKAYKFLKDNKGFKRFVIPPLIPHGTFALYGAKENMEYQIIIQGDIRSLQNIAKFFAFAEIESKKKIARGK